MKKIDKVLAAFKKAGFAFDKTNFEDRLVAQKLVYLAQELGVDLGYQGTYNFYLRGTYSPTLTKDLFQPEGSPAIVDAKLAVEEARQMARVAEMTSLRPHILEVMSAYRFLRNTGKDQDQAVRLLKTHKPFISSRDVAIGVSKCKSLWPEVTGEDVEALQQEMEPWDRAAAEDGDDTGA